MLDLGSIVKVATANHTWVKKPVEWSNGNGDKISGEAEFKKAMSARDFEVIQFGEDPKPKRDSKGNVIKDNEGNVQFEIDDEDSRMARRVQRLVRFNGEHLTAEQAKGLDWSFLALLCSIQAEIETPQETDSKNG